MREQLCHFFLNVAGQGITEKQGVIFFMEYTPYIFYYP
jgi:hypothetical protein